MTGLDEEALRRLAESMATDGYVIQAVVSDPKVRRRSREVRINAIKSFLSKQNRAWKVEYIWAGDDVFVDANRWSLDRSQWEAFVQNESMSASANPRDYVDPIALEKSNPLGVLSQLKVKNFTVFTKETFDFSEGLNVIVGENGAGKTHLLKLAYAASKALYPARARNAASSKEILQRTIAEKLSGVFLPDDLGRLCRRIPGRQRSDVELEFGTPGRGPDRGCLAFSFSSASSSNVSIEMLPSPLPLTPEGGPIFLPTREVISLVPDIVDLYRQRKLRFEETYFDVALALQGTVSKGKRPAAVERLVAPLETAMGGKLYADADSGRFYLRTSNGAIEMPLLAEGLRKFAMLAYLILNGALARHGTVYWDEPEANENPRLMGPLADTLVQLARDGVQVFIATHSLFFLREIALRVDRNKAQGAPVPVRYFSLAREGATLRVERADDVDGLGMIASLDAALKQDDEMERLYWETRA